MDAWIGVAVDVAHRASAGIAAPAPAQESRAAAIARQARERAATAARSEKSKDPFLLALEKAERRDAAVEHRMSSPPPLPVATPTASQRVQAQVASLAAAKRARSKAEKNRQQRASGEGAGSGSFTPPSWQSTPVSSVPTTPTATPPRLVRSSEASNSNKNLLAMDNPVSEPSTPAGADAEAAARRRKRRQRARAVSLTEEREADRRLRAEAQAGRSFQQRPRGGKQAAGWDQQQRGGRRRASHDGGSFTRATDSGSAGITDILGYAATSAISGMGRGPTGGGGGSSFTGGSSSGGDSGSFLSSFTTSVFDGSALRKGLGAVVDAANDPSQFVMSSIQAAEASAMRVGEMGSAAVKAAENVGSGNMSLAEYLPPPPTSLLEVAGNASAYAAGAVGKIGDAGEVLAAGVGHGTAAAIRGGTAYVNA